MRCTPRRNAAALGVQSHRHKLRPGLSVIIPTYLGRGRIEACLQSLATQTLEPDMFEIILVINGPIDGSSAVIDRFCNRNPSINVMSIELADAGASRARNAGIALACREHLTFVDDDDSVSPAFLATLLANVSPGVVPFAHILDIGLNGSVNAWNAINIQTVPYTGRTVHPELIPRAIGFNASKLLPTRIVQNLAYDPALESGVDVVFYMTLLADYDFRLYVCGIDSGPDARNAVYYRLLRPNSMSRREPTFGFNVVARLEVILRLDALAGRCDERRRRVIHNTMRAQAGFIRRYLDANPSDGVRVLRTIESYGITSFPYHSLNLNSPVNNG